jgi:hypothetical protein
MNAAVPSTKYWSMYEVILKVGSSSGMVHVFFLADLFRDVFFVCECSRRVVVLHGNRK